MDGRIAFPRSWESSNPPSAAVFRASDVENLNNLPYWERRATDTGYRPREVADTYLAQPRRSAATPWWTTVGLGLRPENGVTATTPRVINEDDQLAKKLNKYYKEDGLVDERGLPVSDGMYSSKPIRKTTEPQLWRKVGEPKTAILTEVKGELVWKQADDEYYRQTTQRAGPVVTETRPPVQPYRVPFRVYT